MHAIRLFGWVLVAAALLGAAAETAVHLRPGVSGFFLSAHDVLYTLRPGELVVFKIHVETALGPRAWDPVMLGVLSLPLWLIFGVPGAFLVWLGRSRRVDDEEMQAREEALYLYDALARQAEEDEGYGEDEPFPPSSPRTLDEPDARS